MHNYAFYFEFSVIFLMFLMDQLIRPILPKSMKPRILEKLGDVFTRVLHGDLIITKKVPGPNPWEDNLLATPVWQGSQKIS